ncbi:MAG: LrgB family protein [Streptococcaceae bacterium]|jgi:predicted murein hydrolase (TIGR00659 family)|nr:LrgB family protein [Streptococcaceae bacterium]
MNEILTNPLFGLVLSVLMYLIGVRLNQTFQHPLTTPLLFATVTIILFLKITGISYDAYYKGGQILNMLIAPSTVALGIPLYKMLPLLKHHAKSILIGLGISTFLNTLITLLLAKAFGLSKIVSISLLPKSVTTAMAVGIAEKMGGALTLTLVVVVATGILTSVIGPPLLNVFGIQDAVAKGVALGGTGHAIGTGSAIQLGKVEGVMAGVSIGISGILYVFITPIMIQLFL